MSALSQGGCEGILARSPLVAGDLDPVPSPPIVTLGGVTSFWAQLPGLSLGSRGGGGSVKSQRPFLFKLFLKGPFNNQEVTLPLTSPGPCSFFQSPADVYQLGGLRIFLKSSPGPGTAQTFCAPARPPGFLHWLFSCQEHLLGSLPLIFQFKGHVLRARPAHAA